MSPNEATLILTEEKELRVLLQTRQIGTTPSIVTVNDVFLSPSAGEKIT